MVDFSGVKEYAHQFSLFHANLRSLSAHHDELWLLLNALKCCFDINGISETKEPSDGFLNNAGCPRTWKTWKTWKTRGI